MTKALQSKRKPIRRRMPRKAILERWSVQADIQDSFTSIKQLAGIAADIVETDLELAAIIAGRLRPLLETAIEKIGRLTDMKKEKGEK